MTDAPFPRQNDQRILDKLDEHREVLTRLDTKMESLIGNGGTKGRIPNLEAKVDGHATQINTASGSIKTLLWIISGIGILAMAFGGVLLAHILGGK